MKIKQSIIKKLQSGITLPLTITLTLASSGLLVGYINSLYEQEWHVQYKIAVAKAQFNADSGIAKGIEYLYDKKNQSAKSLSIGEQQRLVIIRALLSNPKIILLDEPTLGLDVISQSKIREFVKHYNMKVTRGR